MNGTWWVSEQDLDESQQSVISLNNSGSFLIIGPPGSGKTNLLLLRAKYLGLAGEPNNKIIVFTRALREFIARGAEQYGIELDNIVTSQRFWIELLYQYGIPWQNKSDFQTQRRGLVERVTQLVQENDLWNIYQTILLDEAHDFLPEEVELFGKLSRSIFAVADKRQKIYSGKEPFDALNQIVDRTITLTYHYRNGRNICELADSLGKDRNSFKSILPTSNYNETLLPSTVSVHKCDCLDHEIDLVIEKLNDQLKAYPDELIGVISPNKSAIKKFQDKILDSEFGRTTSFHNDDLTLSLDQEVRICVSTIHAAKGLEFRALHVLSCDKFKGRPLPRSLSFTAVTRAKTSLDLYYSDSLLGFIEEAISSIQPPREMPQLSDLFELD